MGAGIAASPHCAERRICRTHDQIPGEPDLEPTHQLRRRFPPTTPSRGGARRPLLQCATRRPAFRFVPPGLTRKSKPTDVPRPFLGCPPLASRFACSDPKTAESRVAQLEEHLFRRLVPAGLEKIPKDPLIACRGDRTFGHLPRRLAVAGRLARRRTAVPITRQTLNRDCESRQAKKVGASLWISWIS